MRIFRLAKILSVASRFGLDQIIFEHEPSGRLAALSRGLHFWRRLDTPRSVRLRQALNETWQRDSFDHLINNAGHGDMASIADTTEAQFDALVNVHFKGVFFLTQSLLPLMADGGRIVNISSGLTRVSYPGFSAYSAVKGAVEVLSLYMAKELGSRGIAVNTVAPGAIETDFLGGAVRDMPDLNKVFADMTALGRVGVPDDIGPMIASLLGEQNRWVNAQRIEVSGGQAI